MSGNLSAAFRVAFKIPSINEAIQADQHNKTTRNLTLLNDFIMFNVYNLSLSRKNAFLISCRFLLTHFLASSVPSTMVLPMLLLSLCVREDIASAHLSTCSSPVSSLFSRSRSTSSCHLEVGLLLVYDRDPPTKIPSAPLSLRNSFALMEVSGHGFQPFDSV